MKNVLGNKIKSKSSALDVLLDSITFHIESFRSEIKRVEREAGGDSMADGVREALSQQIRQSEWHLEQIKKLRTSLDQRPALDAMVAPLSKLAELAYQASIAGGKIVTSRKSLAGMDDRTPSEQFDTLQLYEIRSSLLDALSMLADLTEIATQPQKLHVTKDKTAEMRSAITSIQGNTEILMDQLERVDEILDEKDVRIPEVDWIIRFLDALQLQIDALQAALDSGADKNDSGADATEVDR